jgi:hypothetical protein
MCVILWCPGPGRPSLETFAHARGKAPDGIAIAWSMADGVRWLPLLRDYRVAHRVCERLQFPYAVHFKLQSVPGDVPQPAPVGPWEKPSGAGRSTRGTSCLFLNGEVPDWRQLLTVAGLDPKRFKDSCAALAALVELQGPAPLDVLDDSRWLLLQPEGRVGLWGRWHPHPTAEGVLTSVRRSR